MGLTKISTDGVKDDAITSGKIPANAIGNSELAVNSVQGGNLTNSAISNDKVHPSANIAGSKLADNSISLAKLEHGTSSNDGKFLRANNGADPSFETVTSTIINGNADNRLITGSASANTLEAESNLTWDGTTLNIGAKAPQITFTELNGNPDYKLSANAGVFKIVDTTNSADRFALNINGTGYFLNNFQIGSATTSPGATLHIKTSYPSLKIDDGNNNTNAFIGIIAGTGKESNINFGDPADDDYSQISYDHNGDHMKFKIGGSEKLRVNSNGLYIGNTANAIDEYEEGTFTPNIQDAASGGNSHGNSGVRQGKYVKIGSTVTVMIVCRSLSNSGLNGSHQLFITNLPFRQSGVERAVAWTQVQYFNNVSNTEFGMHFQINNNETIMRFFKMKDNQGSNPAVTFNHWMYSSGYYGFSTTFTYITDQ